MTIRQKFVHFVLVATGTLVGWTNHASRAIAQATAKQAAATPAELKAAAEADYSQELPRIAPRTPDEEFKTFEVQPGFRVELVAAEPLVKDPVAFAFNGEGVLFAVEMCDYSEQETEHLGSIARLVDTDGDGRMDQRTTYFENLSWPTGIWPWKDGVLVAEPPNLLWLRDTDNDGKCDQKETWFTGFGRSNVQGLVNSLRWTVEGYVHGATSSSGAELHAQDPNASEAITLRGRDFVIDPLRETLTPSSGGGQHGMWFNRWGDKFATSNSDHLQQILDIDNWLSTHNPSVPVPSLRRSIAVDGPQAEVYRSSPVEPWRIVRTRLRVSGAVPGVVEGGGRAAGYFTGATGTCIMDREAGYGDAQYDTALVCDVGSNLVHRKRMISKGLFWSGERIDQQSELLRSSDIWFRPVQLGDGPDGALYIADMYREVIEHPKSLPPIIKRHLDLTSGRDKGRIWRVVPEKQTVVTSAGKTIKPAKLSSDKLAENLHHPIAWQRRMASQLLIERQDPASIPAVRTAAKGGVSSEGRMMALHVLHRLNELSAQDLQHALADSEPRVVAHAARLAADTQLAPQCTSALLKATVTEPHAQLALAMAASELPANDRVGLLKRLMTAASDPLVKAVIVIAANDASPRLVSQETANDWSSLILTAWYAELRSKSSQGSTYRKAIAEHLNEQLGEKSSTRDNWTQLLAQLPSRTHVETMLSALPESTRSSLEANLQKEVTRAIEQIEAQPATQFSKQAAAGLRLIPTKQVLDLGKQWLNPNSPESLQRALAQAMLWSDVQGALPVLLPELKRMTPALKREVLASMIGYAQALPSIATALESKEISTAEIAPDVRQQLFAVPDKKQAERFKKLLNTASADRIQVIDRYRGALANVSAADTNLVNPGKATFQRVCAQCHRLQDMGNDVGPPLKQLADKSPEQLLDIILDPNREVDPKFLGYSVLLEDGRVLSGIIREESAGQIVLAETGGKQHTIPRSEITQLKSTGLSLMPVGLEEQIQPQQMAELISYLKAAGAASQK